jgi:hypothetical protein
MLKCEQAWDRQGRMGERLVAGGEFEGGHDVGSGQGVLRVDEPLQDQAAQDRLEEPAQ